MSIDEAFKAFNQVGIAKTYIFKNNNIEEFTLSHVGIEMENKILAKFKRFPQETRNELILKMDKYLETDTGNYPGIKKIRMDINYEYRPDTLIFKNF